MSACFHSTFASFTEAGEFKDGSKAGAQREYSKDVVNETEARVLSVTASLAKMHANASHYPCRARTAHSTVTQATERRSCTYFSKVAVHVHHQVTLCGEQAMHVVSGHVPLT